MSIPVLIGVLVLVLALAARTGTRNTYVKRKLVLSVALAAAYLVAHLLALWPGTPPGIAATLSAIESVLLVLAASNLLVVLAVNPFGEDRLPANLPAILQDAITVAIFAIVVVLFFNDRLQLTAAAGAVVVGLALQDTLGNAMAGLALQADQPYKVGDWIRVGDHEGRVTQISWRSTVLRSRESTLVALPNSSIADSPIVNYSEPAPPTRIFVDVGVSYASPPNHVKAVILDAVSQVPLAMATPSPDVLVVDFANSSITYRARCYVQDMERSSLAQDQMRTAIWYAFQRSGLEIPYPDPGRIRTRRDARAWPCRSRRTCRGCSATRPCWAASSPRPAHDWPHRPAHVCMGPGRSSSGRARPGAPAFSWRAAWCA